MIKRPHLYILLIPILAWALIVFYFEFNGLYGQDAHEYHRYSKSLFNYFKGGVEPGVFYWPIGFPLLSSLLTFVLSSFLSMQVINLLALYGSIYFLREVIILIDRKNKKFSLSYVVLIFSLSPFVFRMSLVSMSDMTALFFSIGSIYYILKYISVEKSNKAAALSIVFASAAVQIRYASIALLIVPLTAFFYSIIKEKKYFKLMVLVLVAFILTAPQFIFTSEFSLAHMSNLYGNNWSIFNAWCSSFTTEQGQLNYQIPNILYALSFLWHPIFYIGFLPIAPFIKKGDFTSPNSKIILISILVYVVFISGIPSQNHRFVLPAMPLLLVLLYPATERFIHKFSPVMKLLIVLVLISVQFSLFYKSFYKIYELNQLEKTIAKEINAQPQKRIYCFGIDVALKTYVIDKEWISLWVTTYNSFTPGSLVLFNEEKYQLQWEGKSVMNNWHQLNKTHELTVEMNFDNGWTLYEIK